MQQPLRIGIVGLGTVGQSVITMIQTQCTLLSKICARPIEIIAVCARDKNRSRHADLSAYHWYDDPLLLIQNPDIDVVVELIGGENGAALQVCEMALSQGKSVVTANKAMLSKHGLSLAMLAESHDIWLCYEAAVAGGIPILKMLREGSSANTIESLYGILNGTCNYILSAMTKTGAAFDDVLAEAQRLGYAEADPTFDIDGIDAAQKLSLLSSMAYGVKPDINNISVNGIRGISPLDIRCASEMGYVIKLLAKAKYRRGVLYQAVYPALISVNTPLAHVDDVFNAVLFKGDFVGEIMVTGKGAGGDATASSVISDLVDLANERYVLPFKVSATDLITAEAESPDSYLSCYYARFILRDVAGAVFNVTKVLADHNVSLRSLKQPTADCHNGRVPLTTITTYEASDCVMKKIAEELTKLDILCEAPQMLRIEML